MTDYIERIIAMWVSHQKNYRKPKGNGISLKCLGKKKKGIPQFFMQ